MSLVLARPLRKLLLLRVRGGWRKQLARLRTPRGILFAAIGVVLFGSWAASALVPGHVREELSPEELELRIGMVALSFFLLTLAGALRFRGLFLPREEIERLLSAPVSRPELVRYRLCAGGLRGLLGGTLVALLGAARMPVPAFAFLGTLAGLLSLTALHQFAAIAFGALELQSARRLKGLARLFSVAGLLGLGVLLGAFFSGAPLREFPLVGALLASLEDPQGIVARATFVLRPWTRAIVATEFAGFLPWFAFDLAAFALLFEATARLPIDFRELSLDTSASIAARIRRRREVGGAAAGDASVGRARRVPWFFGRGPMGAVAWRKTGSILRKAKSTIGVALMVLTLVLLVARVVSRNEKIAALGPILISGFGTFYLCSGLRFDFREELERMEAVKAWPLSSVRIFVSMLLPEAVLVTLLLILVVGAEALLQGELDPATLGCLALLPPFVFGWIALDNALFLCVPMRAVPGQEGVLQNAGRAALLMLVRLVLLSGAAGVGVVAFLLADTLVGALGGTHATAVAAGFGATWCAVVLEDVLLVWIGGVSLRRFDVARDRG